MLTFTGIGNKQKKITKRKVNGAKIQKSINKL